MFSYAQNALRSASTLFRAAIMLLAVLLAGSVMAGIGAPRAEALGTGVGCMINAPRGATVGPISFGHVGWAFQEGGTNRWFFGATEDHGAHPTVPKLKEATPSPGLPQRAVKARCSLRLRTPGTCTRVAITPSGAAAPSGTPRSAQRSTPRSGPQPADTTSRWTTVSPRQSPSLTPTEKDCATRDTPRRPTTTSTTSARRDGARFTNCSPAAATPMVAASLIPVPGCACQAGWLSRRAPAGCSGGCPLALAVGSRGGIAPPGLPRIPA